MTLLHGWAWDILLNEVLPFQLALCAFAATWAFIDYCFRLSKRFKEAA